MIGQETQGSRPDNGSEPRSHSDLTGLGALTPNVLASWAGHAVFVVAGFVLPRLMDRQLGQEALGVWDFGWSLVAYFGLVQAGVVSSINRHVAQSRAMGDPEGINRIVSSVTCILLLMSLAVMGLSIGAFLTLPPVFGERLGPHVDDARWVVLFLGAGLAVQLLFSGFGGVVTGFHRWGLHNAIYAGGYAACVAAMIIAMFLGGGLPLLAFITLCSELASRVVRCVAAYRIFPGLQMRPKYVRWSQARKLLGFGGKSFVPHLGGLVLHQTTNVLIVTYLGPAALALYARPLALVRHIGAILEKLAHVLTPTATSLEAIDRRDELRGLMVKASRYAAFIALPLVTTLTILGGPVLRLWMGPTYDQGLLLAVLAVGYLAWISQTCTTAILVGLNAHGRPGGANLVAAIVGVCLVTVALGQLRWGLIGAALAVSMPLTLVNGVYLPVYACRRLRLSVRRYFFESWRTPVLCVVPYAVCLAVSRAAYAERPLTSLVWGGLSGVVVLTALYWRFALPPSIRNRVVSWVRLPRVIPICDVTARNASRSR